MSIQRPWDEHEDKTLREMWGGGSSAREIANVLPWRTRNAVIGRANRLGIHRPDVAVIPRLEKADAPKVEKAKRASPSVAPVKPAPTLAFPSPVIVAPPPPIAPVAPPASSCGGRVMTRTPTVAHVRPILFSAAQAITFRRIDQAGGGHG